MRWLMLGLWACGSTTSPRVAQLPRATTTGVCAAPTDTSDLDHVPDGATITRVAVHGAGIDGAVATQLQTKAGTKLDHDRLREDVRLLWKLGVASQIAVSAQPDANGYAIDMALRPPLRVVAVELTGATRAQLPMLAVLEGTFHDGPRLHQLTAATTEYMRARGYADATIEATPTSDCDGVVIHVTALLGPHYTIDKLAIDGSMEPVRPAMFEHDLGKVNVVGGTYAGGALNNDLVDLQDRHRRDGWLDVFIANPTTEYHRDRATVSVAVKVTAGKRYRFGATTVKGGTDAQRKLVETRFGKLAGAWYDERAFDAVQREVADALAPQHLRLVTWSNSDKQTGAVAISIELAEARK